MVDYEKRKAEELASITPDWTYVHCLDRDKGRHLLRCVVCGHERILHSLRYIKPCAACKRAQKKALEELSRYKVCAICGSTFRPVRSTAMYCSPKCKELSKARRHPEVLRERRKLNKRLREARATRNGRVDYSITLSRLMERDRGVCQLCGRPVDESDHVYRGDVFMAGNDYPSIDHIAPLSKGGVHQWNNVQLAHRLCNSIKCNK